MDRGFSNANRHLARRYITIHEAIQAGRIQVLHKQTQIQIADVMTKAKVGKAYHQFVNQIMQGWEE